MTTLTKQQSKQYRHDGADFVLVATVRHDDRCGNGHNTFSITGELYDRARIPGEASIIHLGGRKYWLGSAGCIHEEIARYFPKLAPLIPWHLCSTDGPMHYIANTMYMASDRDHWGLREGEFNSFKYHVIAQGEILFKSAIFYRFRNWTGRDEAHAAALRFMSFIDPVNKPEIIQIGHGEASKGKAIDIDAARETAIWPNATLAQLQDEAALRARLPALVVEFRAAVESIGFIY